METVIITGVAGNICVLFAAYDAYMRDFYLIIPSDCITSRTVHENTSALKHMKNVLKADIRPSAELDMRAFKRKADLHSLGEGVHTVTTTDRRDVPAMTLRTPARDALSEGSPRCRDGRWVCLLLRGQRFGEAHHHGTSRALS